MGLDVYFRRDIANVLCAMACASDGSSGLAVELLGDPELSTRVDAAGISQEKLLQVYRLGVRNTLISVGLAFGLQPVGVPATPEDSRAPTSLLWAEVPRDP